MHMHCVDLPKYSHVDSTTVRVNIENFCLVLLTPDKCNVGVFTRKYTTCAIYTKLLSEPERHISYEILKTSYP